MDSICKNKTAIGIYFKIFQVQKTSYNEPTTVVLTSRAFLNQPHRLIVPNFGLKMDGTGNTINNIIINKKCVININIREIKHTPAGARILWFHNHPEI